LSLFVHILRAIASGLGADGPMPVTVAVVLKVVLPLAVQWVLLE
jgi:hypothetical protein